MLVAPGLSTIAPATAGVAPAVSDGISPPVPVTELQPDPQITHPSRAGVHFGASTVAGAMADRPGSTAGETPAATARCEKWKKGRQMNAAP